ncbi:hypothetical protein FDA94_14535 [Herbidospora galbida]|uniref:Uncharacterized protein n=1 Tax=Herbidospora galbida TaxID=2575442 RepID=A0A4U3MIC1_9ACTN|nr:hypothetical protein [Herbidospora galbida]TKK88134.1 hypothetical protein FDA94_14535 [Herbidospora galbida]
MKFSTYAEVFTSEHPLAEAYARGQMRVPGHLLQDVLDETGGRYEVTIEIGFRMKKALRLAAEATRDERLATLAEQTEVTVSLEHLRQHDPLSTRIVYGCSLDREPTDGDLPGFDAYIDHP